MALDWTVVIPVKRLAAAKSRLRGAVPDHRHAELALAMIRDTAAAVLAADAVTELLVVTDDPEAAAAVTELGARVVADPGGGLNEAMRFGADEAAGLGRHRAVLTGDLPALRPADLSAALAAVLSGRAFVADAAGTGTSLLAAGPGTPLGPRFGPGSAIAHARSGAVPLTGDWPGLRQDVDTPADLGVVVALGAGPVTCSLLRDLGLTPCCVPAAGAR